MRHGQLVHHPASCWHRQHFLLQLAHCVFRMRGEAKHCYILCIVILEEQLQIQFQKGFVCGEPIPDNTEVELLAWVVSCPDPCLLPLSNGLPCRPWRGKHHKLLVPQHHLGLLIRPKYDALVVSLADLGLGAAGLRLAHQLGVHVAGDGAPGADGLS